MTWRVNSHLLLSYPQPEYSEYPINRGVIIGREVLPNQLEPIYKALGLAGMFRESGVTIKRRDESAEAYPRLDLLRSGALRDEAVAPRLGNVALINLILACQDQRESPLFEERDITFGTTRVRDDYDRRYYVNILPSPDSVHDLRQDVRSAARGLRYLSGAEIDLRTGVAGMAIAVVDFGPEGDRAARELAYMIDDTVKPSLQGLVARFAIAGYAAAPTGRRWAPVT